MAASVYDFLSTNVFINKPYWKSSGIVIFLWKYYIIISDTMVGSYLNVLFFLLAIVLSKLHEKPRRKDLVTEKRLFYKQYFFST